ncbi:AbrB family transcriptional regulator [Arsenicitalea aurantiaca]|uniref:AbrB family transcriptional regulator n=1 Tax=Arsenicitalea aurantiaca TaxID=1783274 RepID=A0A433XB58_9HYPH|nr:AbrB family transcriptional regulator [Arsenicitalea aurantiaca]RUT31238.1 AbrB family transcriptional regulator [Arsenicitalea aurantiaca]
MSAFETLWRMALTLAISAGGGLIAEAAGLPAGLLMGGALSVTIASLIGVPVAMPRRLRDVGFVLVGLSMGASVARDSLALIPQWPVTMAGLIIELVIIVWATGYMLKRLFGLDSGTAYLSSFPGHLSFIMGIASAGVGNSRQIMVIQTIRVMMLTVCVPIGALFLPSGAGFETAAEPMVALPRLAAVAAACVVAGWIFVRLKVPAGYVLGAMAAATLAKLTGNFDGSLPQPMLTVTFILMGALIGSRFAGITYAEFRQASIGGLIATAMTVGIVTAIAAASTLLVDMPFGQIWLGLAPGALEGMGALGIALGYDTAFIAAHHVTRLLLLSFAIPLVVWLVGRQERRLDLSMRSEK